MRRVLYAGVAAHRLSTGKPVRVMLVAPPGSLKTELLMSLDGLPGVHHIDKVTDKTFISGQIAEEGKGAIAPSLLHRIGDEGILIYPDFSTVLSMNRDEKGAVLADMRRIFDGRLRKEFGTSEEARQWEGRITFIVAVTPDVDRHYSIFQSLGERFIMVRWSRPGGVDAAISAMNQNIDRAKTELRAAVHGLINGLSGIEPSVSTERQVAIAALAEFVVRARTQVPRDSSSKKIIYVPVAEAATRLAQQLCQLAKGSALLDRRKVVEDIDQRVVERAAFDSIPSTRRKILDACIKGEDVGKSGFPPQPGAMRWRSWNRWSFWPRETNERCCRMTLGS